MPNILDQYRGTVMHRQHNVADVLQCAQAPQAANIVELAALRIKSTAAIAVVGRKGALYLGYRQSHRGDPGRIEQHLILHGAAAKSRVIRHAGNGAVLRLDDPILERFEFHR